MNVRQAAWVQCCSEVCSRRAPCHCGRRCKPCVCVCVCSGGCTPPTRPLRRCARALAAGLSSMCVVQSAQYREAHKKGKGMDWSPLILSLDALVAATQFQSRVLSPRIAMAGLAMLLSTAKEPLFSVAKFASASSIFKGS